MKGKGTPRSRIVARLDRRLSKDLEFKSGKILGSMCTAPHSFAKKIYSAYLDKNIGDPGLHKGTLSLENECVQIIGSILSNSEASGHIVSGGTEANIMALWSARNENIKTRPEVIMSSQAHHSFKKAGDLLGLRLVVVPSYKHKLDVTSMRKAISSNTILMVGTAGTTDLGLVDPLGELSEVSEAFHVPIHVDASFGGFIIPFLKDLGYDLPEFDFRLRGVRSVTIDPHKMGMAPIPSGAVLFRTKDATDRISTNTGYLAGGLEPRGTVLGTSPGASIVAVWSLLNFMGREGYEKVAARCMRSTEYLYNRLSRIEGVDIIMKPEINVLGFRTLEMKTPEVSRKLRKKGFAISTFPRHIRLVVMPHVTEAHINKFIEALVDVLSSDLI